MHNFGNLYKTELKKILSKRAVWIMLVIGIMQVHNYTFGKTLITLFLTVVAMLIIIFLGLLVINFITQVYSFFRGIYMELIFRV